MPSQTGPMYLGANLVTGERGPEPYVRPSDWLALPTVLSSDQKFVGLHAVFSHDQNYCAVNCAGAYTVDWGDGSATENIATGVTAYHNFLYASVGSGTLSTRGYRQAIVTITPQGGSNLTKVDLYQGHNATGIVASYTTGWLDIRMAGSLVTTLTVGGATTTVRQQMLEQFEYVGTNGVTNFTNLFLNCSQFQSLVALDASHGTNFTSTFSNCGLLQTIPLIDTHLGTTFSSMFSGCSGLRAIPALVTSSGTVFGSMFNSCFSLYTVPLLDLASATSTTSMFLNCSHLTVVPLFNTTLLTNASSMFSGCSSLRTIPLFNTAKVTNFGSMFNNCSALTSVPLLDTHLGTTFSSMFSGCGALYSVPALNTVAGTNFSNMFLNCTALLAAPALITSAGTSFDSMFNNCNSMQTTPLFNTAAATTAASMFQSCRTLQAIPALNLSNVTSSLLNFAASCPSLRSCTVTGIKVDVSFTLSGLGAAALDTIYTNLASGVTGKTITVTNCMGVAADTPSIATLKGWVVTGS